MPLVEDPVRYALEDLEAVLAANIGAGHRYPCAVS
jgi:hypothetical protein